MRFKLMQNVLSSIQINAAIQASKLAERAGVEPLHFYEAMHVGNMAPASPWQNGFMERFMLTFKQELGSTRQLNGLAELHEAIALKIHYYNTKRIHTALKTTPAAYAAGLKTTPESSDKVMNEMVA